MAAATAVVALVLATTTMADAKPRSRAVVNQAVAVDTQTGRHTSRVAWMVRTNSGGALPSNYAKAQTWCNDCHTTALAVQIMLMGNVTTPTAAWNHSVAANSQCARCTTAAGAFQFVVISNGPVTLSPAGTSQLAGLRAELQGIAASGAAPGDVNAAATDVAMRILGVLQREVHVGAASGGPGLPVDAGRRGGADPLPARHGRGDELMRRLLGADSLRSDNRYSVGTAPHCGASGPIGPRRGAATRARLWRRPRARGGCPVRRAGRRSPSSPRRPSPPSRSRSSLGPERRAHGLQDLGRHEGAVTVVHTDEVPVVDGEVAHVGRDVGVGRQPVLAPRQVGHRPARLEPEVVVDGGAVSGGGHDPLRGQVVVVVDDRAELRHASWPKPETASAPATNTPAPTSRAVAIPFGPAAPSRNGTSMGRGAP